MSYDGWIATGPEPDRREIAEIGNMTSNVSKMWTHALSAVSNADLSLRDTDGWSTEHALPLFQRAVAYMRLHPDEFTSMNPPNKWGSYESAVDYLVRARDACRYHPGTVRWSW